MPNYTGKPIALYPGDAVALFAAEQPDADQASISVAPAPLPAYRPMVFDIQFASAPTGDLLIQAAMEDTDAAYQTVHTSTSKQQDFYEDDGFAFYRAKNSTSAGGGNLTVTVRR